MLAGYIMLLISIIGVLPWGDHYPAIQIPSNSNIRFIIKKMN